MTIRGIKEKFKFKSAVFVDRHHCICSANRFTLEISLARYQIQTACAFYVNQKLYKTTRKQEASLTLAITVGISIIKMIFFINSCNFSSDNETDLQNYRNIFQMKIKRTLLLFNYFYGLLYVHNEIEKSFYVLSELVKYNKRLM